MITKSKFIVLSVFVMVLIALGQSCKKNNETNISSYNSTKSHNMGQNCMNCHKQGGSGDGWFNVAGTVYDSLKTTTFPNVTVNLYTGPNGTGTLKYTILVDAKGNFYTTNYIDFNGGLYPSIQGTYSTHYMSSTISVGQCNSCHGVSTDKLWTN